jgi:hypothetical protein
MKLQITIGIYSISIFTLTPYIPLSHREGGLSLT